MDEPKLYRCPKAGCSYTSTDDFRVQGHIGGAHARIRERSGINHGTKGGYQKHRRRGETACKKCKAAWATHMRGVKAGIKKKREAGG